MADYLPGNADQLLHWMQNFVAQLTIHAGALDVDVADITPLAAGRLNLSNAVADHEAKKMAAKSATTVKNVNQRSAETLIRAMVNKVVQSPGMTESIRADLGLPVRDETKTTHSVGPEVPILYLESKPGQVVVHFGTNPKNEGRNARPAWAKGCVIYRRDPGETNFQMVGYGRRSPFIDTITGAGADYTYIVRYQGSKPNDLGTASPDQTIAARGPLAA